MKKLLIGLLTLSSISSFASNKCDILVKDSNLLNSETRSELESIGLSIVEVDELTSNDLDKLALLDIEQGGRTTIGNYEYDFWIYNIVKFSNVAKEGNIKTLEYKGLWSTTKKLKDCNNTHLKVDKKIAKKERRLGKESRKIGQEGRLFIKY